MAGQSMYSLHTNGDVDTPKAVGILTRTVVRSPVIHWILHARLRHKNLNDAVLVGSDFVHIRQVGHQGHLEHIATKGDFDAQIRAATVFRIDPDPLDEDFIVKVEDRGALQTTSVVPPDLLVLTLSTHDIVFIYLKVRDDGTWHFESQTLPVPIFDRILFQPGEHVAVDPHFRALAVAANEQQVVIYAAKPRERIAQEIRDGDQNWCPIAAQRPLQVEGVIQHIDFLIPPDDDDDHIILLLVVVDRLKTKAIWIDWYTATDLRQARVHPGEPLSSARTVSSLLIPLRNAAFLIITGSEVRKYKNILTGSISGIALDRLVDDSNDDGNSPLQPLWASWCRPHRHRASSREKDHIYLVREDGLVLYIYVTVDGSISNISAGHFSCHVGKVFASLGQTTGPDILVVAGEMSAGRVVSIGHWLSANGTRVDSLSWQETMRMELIQNIPNWASSTDMLVSSLPQSHAKSAPSRDGVYVTSGRQPHGSITEMRYGLEARSWLREELNDLHVITAMWTVPMSSNGSLLIIMATPFSTRAFELQPTDRHLELTEHDETQALDLNHRTLAAGITADGNIVQVTEQSIYETSSLVANFEDTIVRRCAPGDRILAAAIDASRSCLVTAELKDGAYVLCGLQLPLIGVGHTTQDARRSMSLPSTPLAVALAPFGEKNLAAVTTAEHGVLFVEISENDMVEHYRAMPPALQDLPSLCDHLVLLRRPATLDTLAVCGLRDGRLLAVMLSADDEGNIHCTDDHVVTLGQSNFRVVSMADRVSHACVMVGSDTCVLEWTGPTASSLTIDSLWYSDKFQPDLPQGAVVACSQVPASSYLADQAQRFVGSLAMVSSGQLIIAEVDSTRAAVPRQLSVSGTPNRLLYAEQQKCLVVASLQTAIRAFPTPSARAEERRQIWPTIDFIPSRSNMPLHSHDLQPGERVYALLEWSYKEDDKTYAYILVGGSYRKHNGTQGGRVTFLQLSLASVNLGTVRKFETPVYALALYDELTYVVCYGRHVSLYRFSPKDRKWEELCRPLALASPGVYITVAVPLIYVSTSEDSLVTLRLCPSVEDGDNDTPTLTLVASSPQVDRALCHVVVRTPVPPKEAKDQVVLVSTRDSTLVGLSSHPTTTTNGHRPFADTLLFKADLPRSLTRIHQSSIRPPWKPDPPKGVVVDNLIGIASDGTLVGIALLDGSLWQRLFWLQRLCEWSELLSPHSCSTPTYSAEETGYTGAERAVPIGISGGVGSGRRDEVMLRSPVGAAEDRHIDGDVLARLLRPGGAENLRSAICGLAEREINAGTWTREHLEEELGAVGEVIEMLRVLLDRWM
ncbi:hypothetical protein LTR74_010555 [Friedmanniomyces endolithicus]|nr:hypothetical protein LTR74_010555 [Friedmanniomyces endolithicus]